MAAENQYRTSREQKNSNVGSGGRKIEEDYSMFDDEQNQDEDELEDIIEQPIEEESNSGDSDDDADSDPVLAESKAQRMTSKEELMKLRTQMLEMKEELARKTNKIETIRDTLKVNRVKVESRKSGRIFDIEASLDDKEIDEAVKDFEVAQDDSMEEPMEEEEDLAERPDLESDDEDRDNFGFDENDNDSNDEDDYGAEYDADQAYRDQFGQEQDPQVLKLQDKVKLFRHRCVASLGNNLYELALEFLKMQVE